jgi:hypothetical protein
MRTLAAAEDDLVEGALWYEQQRAGLGEQFIDEYQQAVVRILADPRSFPRMETARDAARHQALSAESISLLRPL